ncbi:hypothetical protein FKM82_009610 [Ascaphus truei]
MVTDGDPPIREAALTARAVTSHAPQGEGLRPPAKQLGELHLTARDVSEGASLARGAGTYEMDTEVCRVSLQVYGGMAAALEKLSNEATILAEHQKRIREHNLVLKKLNTNFNQVQSRLERVAAVKPSFSKMHL